MRGVEGKALLVRSVRDYGRTGREAANWYADRFDWAMVVCTGGGGTRLANTDPTFYAQLRARGVPFWFLWMLPRPDNTAMAQRIVDFAAAMGAVGVIIDPEIEWNGKGVEARMFAVEMRERCDLVGLKLGFTSYAIPSFHEHFPWAEFSEGDFDVAFPNTFDRNNDYPSYLFPRAAREYHALGYRFVVPFCSLWAHDDLTLKTPEQLVRYLGLVTPTPGVVFFTMGRPEDDVLEVLLQWRMPAAIPQLAQLVASGLPFGRGALVAALGG